MVINYKKTRLNALIVSTNRLVTVDTGSATAFALDSGMMGMELTNNGPASVFWASSSAVQGSGGFLAMYASVSWFNVMDDFTVYVRADSAAAVVNVNMYL